MAISRRADPAATVQRKLALQRLHGKISVWQDVLYRLHLLQVCGRHWHLPGKHTWPACN